MQLFAYPMVQNMGGMSLKDTDTHNVQVCAAV